MRDNTETMMVPRSKMSQWILFAIGAGIFTWAISLHGFQFPAGKGWSMLRLVYCIGAYLLIVAVYSIFRGITVRFGILSAKDDTSARSRAYEIVLALASVGVAFPLVLGLWKPLFSPYTFYEEGFDTILVFPLFVFGGVLVFGSVGLLIPRRTLARQGVYLLAFIVLSLFVAFGLGNLVHAPVVPTDLRWLAGDRLPPRNNLLVVRMKSIESDWAIQAVKLVANGKPNHIVLLPRLWDISDDHARQIFLSLSALHMGGVHLLIGLPSDAARYAQMSHQLDFAIQTGYYDARFKPSGLDGLPDVAVRIAQLRGVDSVQIEQSLVKRIDRDGYALIEPYSTIGRTRIPVVDTEARDSIWELTCYVPGHKELGQVTFRVDKRIGRLIEENSDGKVAQFFADVFQGRTVIIDMMPEIYGEETGKGVFVSSAVLNIEHNEVPQRPPVWISIAIIIVFLGANLFCYYWARPLRALSVVFLINMTLIALELVLFVEFLIVLGLPLRSQLVLGVLVTLIFFPYEFIRERREISREQTRLNTELRAAREMQMGLMPKEDPLVAGFDISGICLPANEVGGDFFDYVWLDQKKTRLGIAVADVSGKAMKAAITAVMTSGMIYREVGQNESPKSIMRKINKPMYAKLDSRMFTALSFALIDTKKKELRFSNAGQAYPVLKRGKEVTPLEVKGARLPLGVKEDVPYGEMVVKLKKGDTVIFYTDGIPEAKNEKDEFYGFDRFKALAGGIEGASAKGIRDRILEDVKSFTGKSPQYDDMTVVVVRVLHSPKKKTIKVND